MKIEIEVVEYRMIAEHRTRVVEVETDEIIKKVQSNDEEFIYAEELIHFLMMPNEKSFREEDCSTLLHWVDEECFGEDIEYGDWKINYKNSEECTSVYYTKKTTK